MKEFLTKQEKESIEASSRLISKLQAAQIQYDVDLKAVIDFHKGNAKIILETAKGRFLKGDKK